MLLLLDRGFDGDAFFAEVAGTGAKLLARIKSHRNPPVLAHLPDGSYLSDLDGLDVRIIEADLTVTGADGSRVARALPAGHHPARPPPVPGRGADPPLPRALGDRVRLPGAAAHPARRARPALGRPARPGAGDLGPAHPLPAAAHGHGHRGGDPPRHQPRPGQLHHRPARPPARNSPQPAAICPDGPADLLGVIGRAVLATLLPARRPRYSARKVKCATSRYLNRDDGRPATSTTITAIDIAVHTPPLDLTPRTRRAPAQPRGPRPPTRRHRVIALNSDPRRAWTGRELAEQLQVPRQHAHPARRMDPARLPRPHRSGQLRPHRTLITRPRMTIDPNGENPDQRPQHADTPIQPLPGHGPLTANSAVAAPCPAGTLDPPTTPRTPTITRQRLEEERSTHGLCTDAEGPPGAEPQVKAGLSGL